MANLEMHYDIDTKKHARLGFSQPRGDGHQGAMALSHRSHLSQLK